MKLAFWRKKPGKRLEQLSEVEMGLYLLCRVRHYVYINRKALCPPDRPAAFSPTEYCEFNNWGDVLTILHAKARDCQQQIEASKRTDPTVMELLAKWQAVNACPVCFWSVHCVQHAPTRALARPAGSTQHYAKGGPTVREEKLIQTIKENTKPSPADARDIATDPPAPRACVCCE